MKFKFCVKKYATLCPSPDRRHYIIQKAKAAEGLRGREREIGEPLVFTHRSPLFLRPTATAATTRYCQTPDGRTAVRPGRLTEAIHASTESCMGQRGQREGLDGWSHNELGLETTLGPDDPILGRQPVS